jgi:hypothetical protein
MGRPIDRCDCCCGCACAIAQDKNRTDDATTTSQSRLFVPRAVFIPGDQFIQISHDVVVLWIDFCHDVHVIWRRPLRDCMVRDDSHADHDGCHSRRCNKPSQAKPVSRPLERSRFLADFSQHVPSEKRRKRRLRNTAENLPQLVVILAFHSLQTIKLTAPPEVALECVPKMIL